MTTRPSSCATRTRRRCSCLHGTGPSRRKDTEVYGTKGYAIAVNPTQVRTRFSEHAPEETTTAPPLAPPEDTSLHYLAAVLRGELKPQGDLTALDTNMVVMQILDAARESAKTGKTVALKPLPQ